MVPGKDGVTLDNIDLTHAKDIQVLPCYDIQFKWCHGPKGTHRIDETILKMYFISKCDESNG